MSKTLLQSGFEILPLESIIAFMAILVAAGTTIMLWMYRQAAEVKYLISIEILAAVWALASGAEFLASNLETKMMWSQLSYLGISFLPVCYFLFTTAFSQKFHLITPRNIALLSVIPVITLPLIFTNSFHHLVWQDVTLHDTANNTLNIEHGIWFWIFWSYAITLIIAGLYNLFLSIYEFTSYFRSQVTVLLIATLIPLTGNLAYITGINPIPGFDWTPILFVFTGLVITFGIIRYRMFYLIPFARNNLIETMSDGVIIVNSEGFIEDCNPAVYKIFNLKASVIRKRFSEEFGKHLAILPKLQAEESSLVEIVEGAEEDTKTYQVRITPIYNRIAQFSGHLLQLNDVTSLKKTERQLRLVNQKLEAEVEERGRLIEDLDAFAHTVAHDLRNSLGAVYNSTGIVEECIQEGNTELAFEFSEHIKTSAKKAIHITDELLLLATVNHHLVDRQPIEMDLILRNALNQISELVKTSRARISYADNWPVAIGYAPWIEEVWVNFLTNSIKYGGKPPVINVGAVHEEHYIRFWISDNGNGIPPAQQNKLFKKYTRLNRDMAEGFGLGLSIVKRIVRKMDGFVGVESSGVPGEGACFWFCLPAADVNKSEMKVKDCGLQ